jgi:hypothetical protein
MSALLAAALDYAAKRLPVFPCVGKLPAVARGFHSATTNPETIKRYWRASDRNIGIPTGSVSGFWVLDIDGGAGEAGLRDLEVKTRPVAGNARSHHRRRWQARLVRVHRPRFIDGRQDRARYRYARRWCLCDRAAEHARKRPRL